MTYEELVAQARKLAADGQISASKRALAMAESMKSEAKPEDVSPNPDGTYGEAPEGMVYNPYTGQMTSRELLSNNIAPSAGKSAAVGAYQGLSYGFGDEVQGGLNAAIPGQGTASERYAYGREYARALEDAARRDHAGATMAGEIGGALATGLMPLGAGANLTARGAQVAPGAARAVSSVAARAPMTTRAATSAATGAGMAGLYGWGTGEGGVSGRAESARDAAILGAGIGAATPYAGAGIQKYLNARAGRKAIMDAARAGKTTSELFDEGQALYGQITDAGVTVKPTSAVQGYGNIALGLAEEGADELYPAGVPHPTPAGAAAYNLARSSAEKASTKAEIPFRDVDRKSRTFRNISGSNLKNRDDTRIAQGAKEKFDNWILSLTPDDVVSGDVETLTNTLPKARETWSRARKSQMLDDAVEQGQNYLSGGASGIKNRIKSILRNEKIAGQFTPAEREAMRRVIDGTPAEKLIDTFGGGLGQMATMAAGGAAGSGMGWGGALGGTAIGAAVGQGARRASEALAAKSAETARAAIASGKLTGNLPIADPKIRAIVEQLMRAEAAVAAN